MVGDKMQKVVKTIDVTNGKLFGIVDTNRYKLADCEGKIEIIEHSENIPTLGTGNIITRRLASMLITFNHIWRLVDIHSLVAIGFQGDILRSDGVYESVRFDRCLLVSDLDLTDEGQCTFEIQCSENMLRKLRFI